jgi:hypothetical protein
MEERAMALLPSLVRFCANRIALLTKIKGETTAGPREDRLTYVNVSRVSNFTQRIRIPAKRRDRGLSTQRTEPGLAVVTFNAAAPSNCAVLIF